MFATPSILESSGAPCIHHHHTAPDLRCMGCRMAMGAPAQSYYNSRDQQCYLYYTDDPPSPSLAPLNMEATPEEGESDEESYLLRMRFALQEMDEKVEFVLGGRFLDLGCCPGGFSTYVLNKLPFAYGEGVSLPVELGGHSLKVSPDLCTRFHLHWGDITRYDHAPRRRWHKSGFGGDGLARFPVRRGAFDLVLADGHTPPGLYASRMAHQHARELLLVSQVLAAVRAVRAGGTLLTKLSLAVPAAGLAHRVVVALGGLSHTDLLALKPQSVYAAEASFYVLVRDVEAGQRAALEAALEDLWVYLVSGQKLNSAVLDRLVPRAEVKQKQVWLKGLFKPVEDVRRMAMLQSKDGGRNGIGEASS